MTYTCKDGYEFREDPVALPSPVSWVPFNNSLEYFMQRDSRTDSWQAARVKCQALGGDLASVTSLAVQQFLTDTFQDLDHRKWIGGRLGGSGSYEWVNGETVGFEYFSHGLSPSLECLAMKEDDNGKWEDEDCTENDIDRFFCERGNSSSSSPRANSTSSVDFKKERKVSCLAAGNTSAQWSYDYEVPRMCYSMWIVVLACLTLLFISQL